MTRRIGSQLPRLSNLPLDIDNTDAGDEVIEFARRFGVELDEWQQWVVRHMCAERVDGSWASSSAILLVPRQCGKSAILEVIEMAALFLWDERHIIYSAHLGKTATDHMRRIHRHIKAVPDFERIARVLTGKGDERVERTDTGAILEFITRGKKSARGGSPNRVIFDEAMFLKDSEMAAMLPSLSAQSLNEEGAPQLVYASSAPIGESEVLHRLRNQALRDSPPRMFFAEWSALPDCDYADRENWYTANPGLGIRISEEWIADNEYSVLSPEAFGTERLGIPQGGEGVGGPIDLDAWRDLGSASFEQDTSLPYRLAIDVSPDRQWASIGVAGYMSDGTGFVDLDLRDRGTAWVVPRLAEAKVKRPDMPPVIVDAGGPAGALIGELRAKGIEVDEVGVRDHAQACGAFLDAVLEGRVRHRNRAALNDAVAGARQRQSQDVWLWSRAGSAVDISPLVAVTLAWGKLPAPQRQVWAFVG